MRRGHGQEAKQHASSRLSVRKLGARLENAGLEEECGLGSLEPAKRGAARTPVKYILII